MGTKSGCAGDEIKEKRNLIRENLDRLKDRVLSLQKELESAKKDSEHLGHLCWWDGKPCDRYMAIRGLREAGPRCRNCIRLDQGELEGAIGDISPSCLQRLAAEVKSVKEEAGEVVKKAEDEQEQAENQTKGVIQEIYEEVLSVADAVGIESVD